MDFGAWHRGEPNDWGSGEDCGGFYEPQAKNTATWNDQGCGWEIAYICGYLGEPVAVPEPVP
jgi:hypothetical protein